MNSKYHLIVSFLKSIVRLIGAVISLNTKEITPLAGAFLAAEILGMLEELGDKR